MIWKLCDSITNSNVFFFCDIVLLFPSNILIKWLSLFVVSLVVKLSVTNGITTYLYCKLNTLKGKLNFVNLSWSMLTFFLLLVRHWMLLDLSVIVVDVWFWLMSIWLKSSCIIIVSWKGKKKGFTCLNIDIMIYSILALERSRDRGRA